MDNLEFFLEQKLKIESGVAMYHPFLSKVKHKMLSIDQLRFFMKHWFQMAKAHRINYPKIIANITDDNIRLELINILYEEYGFGEPTKVHGRVLAKLLLALGITEDEAALEKQLLATQNFIHTTSDIWGNGHHALAYGLHFGLEYLASFQQSCFSIGMAQYNFLSLNDREYFDIHAEAEVRHVKMSEDGFLSYAKTIDGQENLANGIAIAETLLGNLWDELETKLNFY